MEGWGSHDTAARRGHEGRPRRHEGRDAARRSTPPRRTLVVARGGARAAGVRGTRGARARTRHDRGRRDPRRRVHGHVDRVVPEGAATGPRRRAARIGHLRRRAERPQRRVLRRVVGEDPRRPRDLRRRGCDGTADDLRARADRDRHVVPRERGRRMVPPRRRPRGRDERAARGGLGGLAGGRARAGRRGRVSDPHRRRGPAAVRVPTVRQRGADRRRRDRPPREAGPGPPAPPDRERRPDLRTHDGHAARHGCAGDGRDAGWLGAGGRRRGRPRRVGDLVEGLQATAHAPGVRTWS